MSILFSFTLHYFIFRASVRDGCCLSEVRNVKQKRITRCESILEFSNIELVE
ncbi:hypothetical protein POPTR_010G104050v4 [Populus trichocarpa]|uniref:Uncharacterized protein n=1 Tax=Populus trichocarpa TaxID=3694 RepID=A0ACC0SBY9_POPTR|nr:hypothetical protein BDE02_10G091700 [Populus trichocarpa]KAI9386998.1 hypothetical protein POPTR_010G104050v4 [Populus trichocarpa]